ncbi:MAG: hypothetical protein ACM359_21460 [Bacillota bacterium]
MGHGIQLMRQIMRISTFAVVCVLGFVTGCESWSLDKLFGDSGKGPSTQPSNPAALSRQVIQPGDPMPVGARPVVNLTVYHLLVPAGTVSRNEAFWKHVDERAIDMLTYDVLYKNGLRVGRAPMADIEYFMEILERGPVENQPTLYAAAGAKYVEVMMKKDVAAQTIYDFDLRNVMTIRSYDLSDNVFCLDFQPAPRKAGSLRVSIVPMVRTQRKRLQAVGDFETQEFEYVSPEKRFDLSLRTDIPQDGFLIIAPSPEAVSAMSLGYSFMVHDGGAEQLEDVLLLIPQAMRRPAKAAATAPTGKS